MSKSTNFLFPIYQEQQRPSRYEISLKAQLEENIKIKRRIEDNFWKEKKLKDQQKV